MALRFALAQINTTVGDLHGNAESIRRMLNTAKENHVDLIVFPELCVCGYPPEDLLLRQGFIQQVDGAVQRIIESVEDVHVVFGAPRHVDKQLFNAALSRNPILNISSMRSYALAVLNA